MGDSNPTSSSASAPEGILARGEGGHPPGGAAPAAPASTTRLYDRTYAGFELDARQQVRLETYGEDLGQNSSADGGRMARNYRLDCAWSRLPRPRRRVWRRRTCGAPCRHHGRAGPRHRQ